MSDAHDPGAPPELRITASRLVVTADEAEASDASGTRRVVIEFQPPAPRGEKRGRNSRTAAIATALLVLGVCVALSYIRVWKVRVHAVVASTALQIHAADTVHALEGALVRSVTATAMRPVTPPMIPGLPPLPDPGGAPVGRFRADARDGGQVQVVSVTFPDRSRILVTHTGLPDHYRISYTCDGACPPPVAQLLVSDAVTLGNGQSSANLVLERPRLIDLELSPSSELTLHFKHGTHPMLVEPLEVSVVDFTRRVYRGNADRPLETAVSGLLGGELTMESVGDRRHALRAGQWLRMKVKRGQIERATLDSAGVAVAFSGTVTQVQTGPEEDPQNLVPTQLEAFHERQGLRLLLVSFLAAYTAIHAFLQRFWKPE